MIACNKSFNDNGRWSWGCKGYSYSPVILIQILMTATTVEGFGCLASTTEYLAVTVLSVSLKNLTKYVLKVLERNGINFYLMENYRQNTDTLSTAFWSYHSLGMQMETFAKHQEFRRQIASFYQQVIGQICRFRRIWPFCTRCDIGKDLSGHKTRERIKLTGVTFLQKHFGPKVTKFLVYNTRVTVKMRLGVVKLEILEVVL